MSSSKSSGESKTFEIRPLVGTPLDYSRRENWMVFHKSDVIIHPVDVFFLYPTSVSIEVKTTVCEDIKYMEHNSYLTYLQSADTLSLFTNVFAPYYRQISAAGIMSNLSADAFMEAVWNNVTRTDVYAALDYYFENCNGGRPYILAGHSQGSCNLKIVLSEYMKLHSEYLEKMVACYAIGYYFPDSWFEENPQIKKAQGETDTGCLITWNTEGPGGSKPNLPLGNNDGFCINPLNWKTDETPADASLNMGSLFIDNDIYNDVYSSFYEGKSISKYLPVGPKIEAMNYESGMVDARIDKSRGAIITDSYDKFIPDNIAFGDKSCHFEDWSLFSINIRENAKKRIEAFLNRNQ